MPPPLRLPGATVLGGGAFTEGVTLLPSPIVLGAAFVAVVTVGRDGRVGFGVVSLHATVMTAIVNSAAVPAIAANQRAFGRGGAVFNRAGVVASRSGMRPPIAPFGQYRRTPPRACGRSNAHSVSPPRSPRRGHLGCRPRRPGPGRSRRSKFCLPLRRRGAGWRG